MAFQKTTYFYYAPVSHELSGDNNISESGVSKADEIRRFLPRKTEKIVFSLLGPVILFK